MKVGHCMELRLGKLPAVFDKRDFRLKKYLTAPKLYTRPPAFGHEMMIDDWGMLGNDRAGCCVFSGSDHEHMIWCAEGGKKVEFTTQNTLDDYSAVTGYNPNDPNTDNGTMVRDAYRYRRDVGLIDAQGNRHKIDAYVALDPGDTEDLLNAIWLFGTCGLGLAMPSYALKQFERGNAWEAAYCNGTIVGGHYVNAVAYRKQIYVVTWGRLQPMTLKFYKRYCDEAYCMLSSEMFASGRTLEGFDYEQLQADLISLRG